MSPMIEVPQYIKENKTVVFLYVLAAHVFVWLLWRPLWSAYGWLRIEIGIRNSGAPKGPPFLQVMKASASPAIHRIMEEWVREFGPGFWYRLGPFHVRLRATSPPRSAPPRDHFSPLARESIY